MALSKDTIRRLIIALTGTKAGNEVIGSLGSYGGFQLNSDGTIKNMSGAVSVVQETGEGAGVYRVMFPDINSQIKSIDWFEVAGFTPRNPTVAETAIALVTGYNFDSTLGQWYVTVQIEPIGGGVSQLPPQGFVVGIRAAFTLNPNSNQL